jgi:predicted GTPase
MTTAATAAPTIREFVLVKKPVPVNLELLLVDVERKLLEEEELIETVDEEEVVEEVVVDIVEITETVFEPSLATYKYPFEGS